MVNMFTFQYIHQKWGTATLFPLNQMLWEYCMQLIVLIVNNHQCTDPELMRGSIFFFVGTGIEENFYILFFKAKNILDNITVKIHCKWSSQGLRLLDPCMDKLIDLVIKKQNFLLNLNFISFCKCIYLLPCLLSFKKK